MGLHTIPGGSTIPEGVGVGVGGVGDPVDDLEQLIRTLMAVRTSRLGKRTFMEHES